MKVIQIRNVYCGKGMYVQALMNTALNKETFEHLTLLKYGILSTDTGRDEVARSQ